MYKILLVEDDFALAKSIEEQIMRWGNEVRSVTDFQNVVSEFVEYEPQLVLLDIMLPFFNGYYWCRELRRLSNVPIVFISSASDDMNIVMAMDMGGDDFICKPFEPMVLTAKLQAVIRRTYELSDSPQLLEFSGAILNLNDCSVTFNNEKIELSKNEFRILKTLVESKGKVVSRETLMLRLWQSDIYVEENTLTANVNRLRKKLERFGLSDIILTKSGIGYVVQ